MPEPGHPGAWVDGHSTHGVVRLRSANSASNATRRRAYGQPVGSSYRWTRSKATKCAGHSTAAFKRPRRELRERIDREVKKRWQPQVRAKAKKQAATTTWAGRLHPRPLRVHRRPGTTDDTRIRDITQALPPEHADRLFTARERGATEQQLQQIAAEDLAQMHFRANNTRAHGLGVEFTDIEQIGIEL
ncbi:telomere-protecting terminal protein Tpg [Streptomyces sp. NPDC001852]|uniref:telomere-protecting terminal protein Tpg n=1 Tax=Streptomyces sp. NPDC001852 TaxID=3364619 RepID=UPI0036D0194E